MLFLLHINVKDFCNFVYLTTKQTLMKVKNYFFLIVLSLFITSFIIPRSTNTSKTILIDAGINTDGKEVTVRKGCTLCHHPDKKIVGPSFKEIAQKYNGEHDKLLTFLNGKGEPIVKPEEFQFMKPVLNQLKHTSKEDKEAIVKYILSLK